MEFYFQDFEDRVPPNPTPHSVSRELVWQFLATLSLVLGGWYIAWRWSHSINPEALWLSLPLLVAETLSYIGLILWSVNLWCVRDTPEQAPPERVCDAMASEGGAPDRPISVDIFITTLDEEIELVRLSLRDAKRVSYPHPIDVRVSVLDDGRRDSLRKVASEEGVHYITRSGNAGFKAGNLRNAMEQTSGDFIVICDADTRLFPSFLENTLGYFRDPKVAWVQTPQWFYDLPEGDPMGNDPMMFYDVILRRRNWANAVFCCGAGSIHRREAVMWAALRSMSNTVDETVEQVMCDVADDEIYRDMSDYVRREVALETELTPYKFHVSEDIYTSIELHADGETGWKSVYHPKVESKMLSPQDLDTFLKQRFRYAAGTLDIAFRHNPISKLGLSIPQKVMYSATIWSYLSCIWGAVFLTWPIIHLYTGISPISSYSPEFYKHLAPFLIVHTLALAVGTWGIKNWRNQSTYTALFALNLAALWSVLRGKPLTFNPTRKSVSTGSQLHLVWPQLSIVSLSLLGVGFAAWQVLGGYRWDTGAVVANSFWALYNSAALSGFIFAGFASATASESSS